MLKYIGEVFNKLTVVEEVAPYVSPSGRKKRRFVARCSCGNFVTVHGDSLRAGHTQSCGCYKAQRASECGRIHGETGSKLYIIWANMLQRCTNVSRPDWNFYGGRGITYQDGWGIYSNFKADMGSTYFDGASLDRYPDLNGNYSVDNCRWVVLPQQKRNRRQQITNTSGKTGVYFTVPYGTTQVKAQWMGLDGKQYSKSFSTRKYGLLEAFALACAYRDKMILELNEQGAGYTEHHGK